MTTEPARWERVHAQAKRITAPTAEHPVPTNLLPATVLTIELVLEVPTWITGNLPVAKRYGQVYVLPDREAEQYGHVLNRMVARCDRGMAEDLGFTTAVHRGHGARPTVEDPRGYATPDTWMLHPHAVVTWPEDAGTWCYPTVELARARVNEVLALWTSPANGTLRGDGAEP